jgi:hypothetical protein
MAPTLFHRLLHLKQDHNKEEIMKGFTHLVKGLDPVADAFSGTVYSDVVSMKNHALCEFVIYKGVGTTGTSTITVEACDDTTPTNHIAIPFKYQEVLSADTHSALKDAGTTGFTTTAGNSQIYRIFVDRKALTESGYTYVRLVATESTDSAVVGAILVILSEPDIDTSVQDESAIA